MTKLFVKYLLAQCIVIVHFFSLLRYCTVGILKKERVIDSRSPGLERLRYWIRRQSRVGNKKIKKILERSGIQSCGFINVVDLADVFKIVIDAN